jgi:transmembrane sensor
MKTPLSSEMLDKYLSGTCSPQEREEVENWYQSFENTPEIGTLSPEPENDAYSQSVFEKIKSKIKEIEDNQIWKLPINKQSYWYLAASILISIGVSFLFEKNHFPAQSTDTVTQDNSALFVWKDHHQN